MSNKTQVNKQFIHSFIVHFKWGWFYHCIVCLGVHLNAKFSFSWLQISCPRPFQQISHLVDAGYFQTSDITHELHTIIENEFPAFQHLKMYGSQLLSIMFGGTSSSLRQLCVRRIFQTCFLNPTHHRRAILGLENSFDELELDSDLFNSPQKRVEFWSSVITKDVLERLVDILSLPTDSLPYFESELLYQQLTSTYHAFRYVSVEYENCSEWYSESEEFSSGEEGESDIEYWW